MEPPYIAIDELDAGGQVMLHGLWTPGCRPWKSLPVPRRTAVIPIHHLSSQHLVHALLIIADGQVKVDINFQ
jgi:hypothetical protein